MKRFSIPTVLAVLFLSVQCVSAGSVKYTVTELPFYANDINNRGQAVGCLFDHYQNLASPVLWDKQGGMQILHAVTKQSFDFTTRAKINDSGQVVYRIYNHHPMDPFGSVNYDLYYWNGSQSQLIAADQTNTTIADINDSGTVAFYNRVSHVDPYYTDYNSYLWDTAGGLRPAVPGSNTHAVADINNSGDIAGTHRLPDGTDAFIRQDGELTNIGRFSGIFGYAQALNDQGQVVGSSTISSESELRSVYHAYIWSDNTMRDLGAFPGHTVVDALDINNLGQVVGASSLNTLDFEGGSAFLWENNVMTDLNSLIDPATGVRLYAAWKITDSGMILAEGWHPVYGSYTSYLLTPVPEPSSIAVLLCGLGTLGGMIRIKKR